MDLIDRQAAIDALERILIKQCSTEWDMVENATECNSMIDFAIERLQELPSAQPEIDELQKEVDYWHEKCTSYEQTIVRLTESAQPERKKGRWIEHMDYPGLAYLCSECNYFTIVESTYCPFCGAEMGVQDATD